MQWDYKLQHLKIVTNGHQYTRTTEDKKFIIWINAHTPIEKQSNLDWNTSIHLKSNRPYINVPLIFWFLIMIFYLCFYHQLWFKWVCIDIGNSSGYIRQTHSRFPKYLTLNERHIQLTSLIICLINNNLTNTSSTPPPEGEKKTVLSIAHFCVPQQKLPFIRNLRVKYLTCFKHQINITVVFLSCESFFKH